MCPQYTTIGGYPNTDPYYISPEEEAAMEQSRSAEHAQAVEAARQTVANFALVEGADWTLKVAHAPHLPPLLAILENAGKIARALLAREDDARQEMRERCAKAAKEAIENWAHDIGATREEYIDSVSSGQFQGRRIKPEMAKQFAREFGERASAVDGCVFIVEEAIRSLPLK
jgi:hypothetical protein